jgi:hypothetical protein
MCAFTVCCGINSIIIIIVVRGEISAHDLTPSLQKFPENLRREQNVCCRVQILCPFNFQARTLPYITVTPSKSGIS